MIKSMTGFGKAETLIPGKKIKAEIRSLNSKQLDLNVKLPSVYRSFENEVRSSASKVLQRGKADIFINVEIEAGASGATINKSLFGNYFSQLKEMVSEVAEHGVTAEAESQFVCSVLRMPDVVCTSCEDITEEEKAALLSAVGQALEGLDSFRSTEGGILIKDILERVDKIEQAITEIEPYESSRIVSIRERINDAIAKSGVQVDSNRFEQEMIFYLEKLDVTEEKVRLTNHCRYFREVASSEENPGRKLGFISQEMGREINTLGSKANNSDIQKIVVGMKDELEKIKEQLLNIL